MNTAPSGITQSPFIEPTATSMTSAEFWSAIESLPRQSGLRPKRLKPTETNPDKSRDLYCIAPPIGRYDITYALGRWIVMLTDHCNTSRIIARCGGIDEAVTAMQDYFDTRMMEGLEYE